MDTPIKELPLLQKVYWQDVRAKVANVNPALATIIDAIAPGKQFPLYTIRYRYGELVVDQGKFQVPDARGRVVPLNVANIATSIKEQLLCGDYAIPPGVILKNSIEVGVTPSNFIFPAHFYMGGTIFALWGYLDDRLYFYHPHRIFTLTAGARCSLILPKINQKKGYKNLWHKYGLRVNEPKDLFDQQRLFVDIARQKQRACDWFTELLFFTNPWINKINHCDRTWLPLRTFLLDYVWGKTAYFRNKYLYDSAFSWAQANRNLRPNPYLADTVKYLLGIACGAVPAFVPAVNEIAAPIKLLQKVFVDDYGLNKYVPTIMHPGYFNPEQPTHPVYYSLHFPTAIEFSPRSCKLSVPLQELCELKHITSRFMEEIRHGKVNLHDTIVEYVANNVDFDFFHNRQNRYQETRFSDELPQGDPNLLKCLVPCKNKEFAAGSSFLRGCIRIGGRKKEKIDS